MKERFLHFIWGSSLFSRHDLRCTTGETLKIIDPGTLNDSAGPDFHNALLNIDGMLWAGNVEIHLQSSTWFDHGHQHDPAYHNTILHVVFEDDGKRPSIHGKVLPTLELQHLVDPRMEERYERLAGSFSELPCKGLLKKVPPLVSDEFLYEQCILRLESKSSLLRQLLENCLHSWEQLLYLLLCRQWGMTVNRAPFELLARSVPYNILIRQSSSDDIEALLLGQAGLLQGNFRDKYPRQLKARYQYLAHKYSLKPVDPALWRMMRMRPSAFPAPRIAQLAGLLAGKQHFFSSVLALKSAKEARQLLRTTASEYWSTHYRFDELSPQHGTMLGKEAVDLLIINCLVPVLYTYANERMLPAQREVAIRILQELDPEKNRLTRAFTTAGLKPANAVHSQGMYRLKKELCDKRACLNCGIGIEFLRSDV